MLSLADFCPLQQAILILPYKAHYAEFGNVICCDHFFNYPLLTSSLISTSTIVIMDSQEPSGLPPGPDTPDQQTMEQVCVL